MPAPVAGLLNVRINEEARDGEASVHGKLGVARSRSDSSLARPCASLSEFRRDPMPATTVVTPDKICLITCSLCWSGAISMAAAAALCSRLRSQLFSYC